ncbi:ComEC/Rec2 family competence protein [Clostridium sp. SHJSY1]|uniref:ComEC/Rec2 family competence protein n=1 Tax=Clostridium sp. SHJSY1 TaxID=2942483 RepID=UPI002875AC3B|nr:ComEC/Rec2 family competence protein [Clostridium sp. SHJSY1]MDS0524074.1 ComEC/Rec2 family competence protein [Clostridium sp. SHJSY1]
MKIRDIEKVSMPIIYISLSLIFGSIIYGIYDDFLWLAVTSACLFFIFVYINTNSIFTIIIILFFALGLVNNISYYNISSSNKFSGKVQVIEEKSYSKIGTFNGKRMYLQGENSKYSLGDNIYVEGDFEKEVDKEKGIVGTLSVKNVKKLDKSLVGRLYSIRENIYAKLKENLGQRKGALIASLAFGYSEYLDGEDQEEMKTLGVIHAISVSGLHVVLVFSLLRIFLGKGISLGVTSLYVLLTGAAFSALRALFMIVMFSLAPNAKKNYNPLSALALSAGIIILFTPYAIFQLGFTLSFLATLGMILFSKGLNNKLYRLPKYIRKTIATSLAAQVFTMPVIMYSFNECSLTFILGNLILEPILNILIILGNFLLIALPIQELFDLISFVLLKVINLLDICTEYLYDISGNSYIVNDGVVMIYCSMFIGAYFYFKGIKKLKILPIAAVLTVLINLYSPIAKVEYLKEGGLLLSYMGERKIISATRNIDMKKLKKINLADEGIREAKSINMKNVLKIKAEGKNFILQLKGKEYLLKINKKENLKRTYDIINFVEKKSKCLFVFGDKLLYY